jgi:hypothetical protein
VKILILLTPPIPLFIIPVPVITPKALLLPLPIIFNIPLHAVFVLVAYPPLEYDTTAPALIVRVVQVSLAPVTDKLVAIDPGLLTLRVVKVEEDELDKVSEPFTVTVPDVTENEPAIDILPPLLTVNVDE